MPKLILTQEGSIAALIYGLTKPITNSKLGNTIKYHEKTRKIFNHRRKNSRHYAKV